MCGGGGGYSLGINPKPPESLLDKKDTWGWSFCHVTFQKKCVPAKKEDIGKESWSHCNLLVKVEGHVLFLQQNIISK